MARPLAVVVLAVAVEPVSRWGRWPMERFPALARQARLVLVSTLLGGGDHVGVQVAGSG
jgi:hypothetical protein